MKNIKQSKIISVILLCIIFLLLLLCNSFTQEIADDYNYHFSWSSHQRITNVFEIFDSMRVHAIETNGRVVAHFFVQLFEMLPKIVFNLINSAMFVALIAVIYRMATSKERNNYLLAAIFGAVWFFSPAFGQVYLWLDGACNYLWAAVFALFYLLPFVNDLLFDKPIKSPVIKVLMVIAALPVGALSENGSAAVIGMMVLFLLAIRFIRRRKFTLWGVLSVVSALVGFYLMAKAPGTTKNKSVGLNLGLLRENFVNSLEVLRTIEILLIVFLVLLVICCICKINRERLWCSLILFAGAIASNFVMVVAAYYPARSLIFTTIFMIAATAILAQFVFENIKYKTVMSCTCAVLMLYTAYYVCIGVNDMYLSNSKLYENEVYIEKCKSEGIMDIKLPMVPSYTKYSAVNGLMYLSTESPEDWPNGIMAKYYGVDSIIGYWE